jgi:4-hydroxy-tetrahydrodipicolinate synthase
MCRAYRSGEQNKATAIQRSMTAIMHMMFEDTSPAPIKAALSMLGLCENELRLPLTPISRTLYEKIQHELSQFI